MLHSSHPHQVPSTLPHTIHFLCYWLNHTFLIHELPEKLTRDRDISKKHHLLWAGKTEAGDSQDWKRPVPELALVSPQDLLGDPLGLEWPSGSSCLGEASPFPFLRLHLQLSLSLPSGRTLGSMRAKLGMSLCSCQAPSAQGRSRTCRSADDRQPGDCEAVASK